MAHLLTTKEQAISLRKEGYSLKEISERLSVSKSTASLWLSSLELDEKTLTILKKKQILGQYKSILLKKELRERNKLLAKHQAEVLMSTITLSSNLLKVICSLLWWCEGNKDSTTVRFTSSDPTLIQNFLFTFRNGFSIDESKFRALVHLHTYHDDEKQKKYWSKVTNIPLTQFYASFQKANTGKRTKEGYQGCVAISYYDAKIAKELYALYNAFSSHRGIR